MGLIGIVLTADAEAAPHRDDVLPAEKSVRWSSDLAEMMATLEEHDHAFPYSVATLEHRGQGARLGAGVLDLRRSRAASASCPATWRASASSLPARSRGWAVPFEFPELTLNRVSIRAVNAVIYAIAGAPRPPSRTTKASSTRST